ncbi:MAG: ethylbenzene dehydrogenase-related protein [Candidatus Magnetominusculus sp. LBB02]|nr:ethylbenzene dehydrogenase-related protein [Candidatus Magnetominusculus sp. LBB02]
MRKVLAAAVVVTCLVMLSALSSAAMLEPVTIKYVNKPITADNADIFNSAKAQSVGLISVSQSNHLGSGAVPAGDTKKLQTNARYIFDLSAEAPAMTVKAVHNGKTVAIQVTWTDKTENVETAIDSFRDSVALMFPTAASEFNPSPLMGSKGEPVNIWQWRADWQAEKEGRRHLEARQPQTEGIHVGYSDAIMKGEFPGKPSAESTTLDYVAEGYGTITRLKEQPVKASGHYKDGKWTVVFLRDINRASGSDAELLPGKNTFMNVAVWNGQNRDVNGSKAISTVWIPLHIEAAK